MNFEMYKRLKQYAQGRPEQLEALTEEAFQKILAQEKEEKRYGNFYDGAYHCKHA